MARPALAATRAVAVLNFLAAHASEEFALSDLASSLDINLASIHALLQALTDGGYVVRHPRLRTYSLGPSVVALGGAALKRHPAIEHARDAARCLNEELGLSVAVTALAGDDIVFLERVGEYQTHDLGVHVGQRIPMTPPIGAVFVAWLDPRRWLEGASDRLAMEAVLEGVRSRGWAASLETETHHSTADPARTAGPASGGSPSQLLAELHRGEYRAIGPLDANQIYDVVMIAAPVFGPTGDAVVAITLLGMEPGLSAERIAAYGSKVREAGLLATRRSGGTGPR